MAGTIMRSTQFRAVVEPILNQSFDGVYDQRTDEYKQIFSEENGIKRAYHEEPVLYGFGAAPKLPDGQPVVYDEGGQLFTQRYGYDVYGLAFALTKVLLKTVSTCDWAPSIPSTLPSRWTRRLKPLRLTT